MRVALVILLILLYVSYTQVAIWFYPESTTNYDAYEKMIEIRDLMSEYVILLALIIGIYIPLLKKNIISFSLISGAIILVISSIIDKSQGINTYHIHDIAVVLGAVIIVHEIYKYAKNKKKI